MIIETIQQSKGLNSALSIDENTVSFWSNVTKIEEYCNSIVNHFGMSNKKVRVLFDHASTASTAPEQLRTDDGSIILLYNIWLPVIPTVITSDFERQRLIYARAMHLRHELAHILFTDFVWYADYGDREILNVLEDGRIEYNYSKVLRGNKRAFFEINSIIFDGIPNKVENFYPDLWHFAWYVSLKTRGFDIELNSNTRLYEDIYSRYKDDFLNNDKYKDAINNMLKDFGAELENYSEMLEQNKNDESDENEEGEEEDKNIEVSLGGEGEEKEEHEGTDEANGAEEETEVKAGQNKEAEGENTRAKGVVEDIGDLDEDFEIPDEPEDTELEVEEVLRNLYDKELSNSTEIKSLSDLLNQVTKSNKEKVFTLDELRNTDIKVSDTPNVLTIPLMKLDKIINGLNLVNKNGLKAYKEVVAENSKTINESVRFLSLKLQNRNRKHIKKFKFEGELDQENLQEVILNPNNPRAFIKQIRSITSTSRIILLIDLSGSMCELNVSLALVNAIIFMEICFRLKLKYSMSFFSSISYSSFSIKNNKTSQVSLGMIKNIFAKDLDAVHIEFEGKYHSDRTSISEALALNKCKRPTHIYFRNRNNDAAVISLKDTEEDLTRKHQIALGNLFLKVGWLRHKFGGSTPEFESLAQVIKLNKKENNILFLLNDGHYNGNFLSNKVKTDHNGRNSLFCVGAYYAQDMMNIINYIDTAKNYINQAKSLAVTQEFKEILIHLEKQQKDKSIRVSTRHLTKALDESIKYLDQVKKITIENSDEFVHSDRLADSWKNYICQNTFNLDEKFFDYKKIQVSNWSSDIDFSSCLIMPGISITLTKSVVSLLKDIIDSQNSPDDIVYKNFVNGLRKNGWRIYGGGIRSEYGKRYIGHQHFMHFNNANDIKENFSKKLREIF